MFYIVSSARSGSTSLAKILDTAENGQCLIEPSPSLHVETRKIFDGESVNNLSQIIQERLVPRIKIGEAEYTVYGEKHVVLAGLVKAIHQETGAKFIYLTRDGRDSVTSLINWHERRFGNIYRESNEAKNLSVTAIQEATNLLANQDLSDYARPRPVKGDAYYERWESFSRFQMCSYYWQRVNQSYRAEFSDMPKESWMHLDFTNVKAEKILECAQFLGLNGLDESQVSKMLGKRINSVEDRGEVGSSFPYWSEWSKKLKNQFLEICGNEMVDQEYLLSKSEMF